MVLSRAKTLDNVEHNKATPNRKEVIIETHFPWTIVKRKRKKLKRRKEVVQSTRG